MKFDALVKKIQEEDIDDISMEIPDYGDGKPEQEFAPEVQQDVDNMELSNPDVTTDELKDMVDQLDPAQYALAKSELEEILSGEEEQEEEEEAEEDNGEEAEGENEEPVFQAPDAGNPEE